MGYMYKLIHHKEKFDMSTMEIGLEFVAGQCLEKMQCYYSHFFQRLHKRFAVERAHKIVRKLQQNLRLLDETTE